MMKIPIFFDVDSVVLAHAGSWHINVNGRIDSEAGCIDASMCVYTGSDGIEYADLYPMDLETDIRWVIDVLIVDGFTVCNISSGEKFVKFSF